MRKPLIKKPTHLLRDRDEQRQNIHQHYLRFMHAKLAAQFDKVSEEDSYLIFRKTVLNRIKISKLLFHLRTI